MMYICFGENNSASMGVGKGETVQAAISNWCGFPDILVFMREYQEWEPTIIEGEEIQIDFDVKIGVTKTK